MAADAIARDLGVQDSSLLRKRETEGRQVRPGSVLRFVFYGIIFIIWIISLFRSKS